MLCDDDLYFQLQNESKRESAFRSLYDRYSGSLFRFIYRFTLNRQIAEEILQEIFLQLLNGKYVPSEGNLKSWLFTVAKHKSLNHAKRASFEISEESAIANAISDSDLEQSLITQNLFQNFSLAESQLPADLEQTWTLRKQGLDYQQISQALSIPVGTVKSRFSRLVEYLKKELNS